MDRDPQASATTTALPELSASQARVLGCLIEKEATTPDTYPLTVNAAHAAANQKTAREPVMALTPGEAQHALRQLGLAGLARQTFTSRAERYAHRTGDRLGLTRQQVALLGLLLLRGPQTAHELLARSERMARFSDVDEVRHHLERLVQHDPPLAIALTRGSGQRGERYAHLLSGAAAASAGDDPRSSSTDAEEPSGRRIERSADPGLEARIAALESALDQLQARVDAIEGRAGGDA